MLNVLRTVLVILVLASAATFVGGCSSNHREVVRPVEPHPPAQTRVAVPVEDERPWYEDAGEVAVIIVGAALLIGGIVLPIILLH